MMILTLDNLAQRYKCLPSEAMSRATTFDLRVLEVQAQWERRQREIAEGKSPSRASPKLSQAEMTAMLERVRQRK
jgi:hypothetical protein